MLDIIKGDRPRSCPQGIPEFELAETLPKWMRNCFGLRSSRQPLPHHIAQAPWASLQGASLHVMFDGAISTHFLAAANSPPAAVDQHGQR
ncbi:hypothetical protein [Sphingosinicella microcystinivorans]|uniref:hypothetical protein n=1 Tax=Sphingosinicella microcystinivorans TaxID=335406 RepID=UPI001FB0CFA3|nr:hypothetical protein [Sphingosinicella microcystinivorans]